MKRPIKDYKYQITLKYVISKLSSVNKWFCYDVMLHCLAEEKALV